MSSPRPTQKTIIGIRKWLSVRGALAFSKNVICIQSFRIVDWRQHIEAAPWLSRQTPEGPIYSHSLSQDHRRANFSWRFGPPTPRGVHRGPGKTRVYEVTAFQGCLFSRTQGRLEPVRMGWSVVRINRMAQDHSAAPAP